MLLKIAANIFFIYSTLLILSGIAIIVINIISPISRSLDKIKYGDAWASNIVLIIKGLFWAVPGLILLHIAGGF